MAQESRLLSEPERNLRAALKAKCLTLASLERRRIRQRARVRNLKERDAGTAYFHMKMKARRRKQLIHVLEHEGKIASTQNDMQDLAKEYFQMIMSEPNSDSRQFNFQHLKLNTADLSMLDDQFSENEVWEAIKSLPNEKSPSPDGYTALFYQKCWDIIKGDIMKAFEKFCRGNSQNLEMLNTAVITLIPKKDSPTLLKDYRPISLIHSFAKLAAKVMAQRLAPRMNELVPYTQNAFIRGRSIHEKFIFVKGLVQQYHRQHKEMILLKLDISKAFDTVSWCFLLDMLKWRGFGAKWRLCLVSLFLTAETSILINGNESNPFKPARGLRQGDPLSPLLFVLATDALQAVVAQAKASGLLSEPAPRRPVPSISIYADDAVLFFKPSQQETKVVKAILQIFGAASGLMTNYNKSATTPIQCSQEQLQVVADELQCNIQLFPIIYLGLPLSTRKPTKAEVQPILDKLANKVAGWKPKLLSPDGRLYLIKSVLMALSVHFMSALQLPKWAIKDIERKCRGFLWKGQQEVSGGHCLVAWKDVCTPVENGGLGIRNLELFGKAMRLKWPANRLH